jgi:hypothetical protein
MANDGSTAWKFGSAINLGVNNAYSPISGTHQPYGWDQMTALYRFYKVVGFTWKITGLQYPDKSAAIAARPVPVNENLALTGAGLAEAIERPGLRVAYSMYGAPVPKLQGRVDIPRLLGVSQEQFDSDVSQYSASVSSAPSRYAYVQFAICGSDVTTFVHVVIECVYTVNFWQRITQTQS